jgi:hypothetical protein
MVDVSALAKVVGTILREQLDPMRARLDALEDVVRNAKSLQYRGVHEAGTAYDAGDTVTYGGSLWHCNSLTKDRPGEGNPAWTLAVKRGRDGKDVTR